MSYIWRPFWSLCWQLWYWLTHEPLGCGGTEARKLLGNEIKRQQQPATQGQNSQRRKKKKKKKPGNATAVAAAVTLEQFPKIIILKLKNTEMSRMNVEHRYIWMSKMPILYIRLFSVQCLFWEPDSASLQALRDSEQKEEVQRNAPWSEQSGKKHTEKEQARIPVMISHSLSFVLSSGALEVFFFLLHSLLSTSAVWPDWMEACSAFYAIVQLYSCQKNAELL